MGMDLIVKRITGWEQDDDPYASQPTLLYPITEEVDWWDRTRLTGRKEFFAFVMAGERFETVWEEPGMWGYHWLRLNSHEGCREWVRNHPDMAQGNAEQLMRLIDESEKDSLDNALKEIWGDNN